MHQERTSDSKAKAVELKFWVTIPKRFEIMPEAHWKIKNAAIFAAMDTTAEELKETVREAFGIDTAKCGLPHTRWSGPTFTTPGWQ